MPLFVANVTVGLSLSPSGNTDTPAVTFNALLAPVPLPPVAPLAVNVRAVFTPEVAFVLVTEIFAPVTVCPLDALAPVEVIFTRVRVLLAAAVLVEAMLIKLPELMELVEKLIPVPVVREFAAKTTPDEAPVPVVTVGVNVTIVPSVVKVATPANDPELLY